MMADTSKMISAGNVAPGGITYVVVFADDHRTLNAGDEVIMAEHFKGNLLIRPSDMTVHPCKTEVGYVVLMRKEQ